MDLEAAAALLGVHYQTAYRLVRTGVLPAVRVGSGYDLNPQDVVAVRDERQRRRVCAAYPDVDWSQQQEQLADFLLRGKEAEAREQLDRLQSHGATVVDLCEKVVSGAIRRLDARQLAGAIRSGEVVAAADLCERLVGTMAAPLPGRPRGLAVVASPAGEGHRLPSLMATAALRANRWRVQHLGSGVPAGDLAEFVEETKPALVVLSLTMQTAETEEFRRKLSSSATVPMIAGGAGEPLSRLLDQVDGVIGPKRTPRGQRFDGPGPSKSTLELTAPLLTEA